VPPRELESRTFRLSSECSNQLSYGGKLLAGVLGLEPRTTESKSVVLPLHHTPTNLASRERLELPPRVLETRMLPLHQRDTIMVDRRGFEPRTLECKSSAFPITPSAHISTHCFQCVYQSTPRSQTLGSLPREPLRN